MTIGMARRQRTSCPVQMRCFGVCCHESYFPSGVGKSGHQYRHCRVAGGCHAIPRCSHQHHNHQDQHHDLRVGVRRSWRAFRVECPLPIRAGWHLSIRIIGWYFAIRAGWYLSIRLGWHARLSWDLSRSDGLYRDLSRSDGLFGTLSRSDGLFGTLSRPDGLWGNLSRSDDGLFWTLSRPDGLWGNLSRSDDGLFWTLSRSDGLWGNLSRSDDGLFWTLSRPDGLFWTLSRPDRLFWTLSRPDGLLGGLWPDGLSDSPLADNSLETAHHRLLL